MKRDVVALLSDEHIAITQQLASVTKVIVRHQSSSKELTGMIDDLTEEILKHLNHEENRLYEPLITTLGKDSPTDEMIQEHKSIRRDIEMLQYACEEYEASCISVSVMLRQFDLFQRKLTDHMKREERVLFWLADFKLNS